MRNVVPKDSRYIPFTQQKSCCVPTCLQMIMYKHSIPLIPAEEIGHNLGLVVNPDNALLFYNVRTLETPPRSGYGTRIFETKYNPTKVFKKLKIPLKVEIIPVVRFKSVGGFEKYLTNIEKNDENVLLCFNYGVLSNDLSKSGGHVVVFDRLKKGGIRIIDPSPSWPKWRIVTIAKMYKAMKKHKEKRSGGVWKITKI